MSKRDKTKFPAFMTASGSARHKLKRDVQRLLPQEKSPLATGTLDPRIEVFTYNNRPGFVCYMERETEKIGMPLTVTARDFQPWNWFGKVGPLIRAMEASTADVVFCADGDDTFPIRFPTWEEVEHLATGEGQVRFAPGANWPNVPWIPVHQHHPTAGLYCGSRTLILNMLKATARMKKTKTPVVYWPNKRTFQDQLAWKFHRHCRPDILKVDHQGLLLDNFLQRPGIVYQIKDA